MFSIGPLLIGNSRIYFGTCFSEVFFQEMVTDINKRCQSNCDQNFKGIIIPSHGKELLEAKGSRQIKTYTQYDKRIYTLRNQRTARCPEPDMSSFGTFTYIPENGNIE